MSYLVMECHPGYVILLDEEGRFLKAANLRYETGQTVYDPVLMKRDAGKAAAYRPVDQQRHCCNRRLLPAVLWHRLLPELSTALFVHISDHQPGGADGSEPAGHGCRAHGDK